MKALTAGLQGCFSYALGAHDTAAAIGNPGVEVASTPALIQYVETACYELVLPFYEPGDATVGVHVCVDHLAPARPGWSIDIDVQLVEAGRRKLDFEVRVKKGSTIVMTGRHVRIIVPQADFAGDGPGSG